MRTDDRPKRRERVQLLELKGQEPSFPQVIGQLLTVTLELNSMLRFLMAQLPDEFRVEAVSRDVPNEKSQQRAPRVVISVDTTPGDGGHFTFGLPLGVQ